MSNIIIPKDFQFVLPKSILLPLDEKDEINQQRFTQIFNLVQEENSHFHVLRITETAEDDTTDINTLKSLLKSDNYKYHHIINVPMDKVVDTYMQTNTIDLEVFIIQKTSFLERLFMGSPITKHSKIASVPLYILHD